MISGLLWKYLNGSHFVMRGGYETAVPASGRIHLTLAVTDIDKLRVTTEKLRDFPMNCWRFAIETVARLISKKAEEMR